jgi:hypothetical protein
MAYRPVDTVHNRFLAIMPVRELDILIAHWRNMSDKLPQTSALQPIRETFLLCAEALNTTKETALILWPKDTTQVININRLMDALADTELPVCPTHVDAEFVCPECFVIEHNLPNAQVTLLEEIHTQFREKETRLLNSGVKENDMAGNMTCYIPYKMLRSAFPKRE